MRSPAFKTRQGRILGIAACVGILLYIFFRSRSSPVIEHKTAVNSIKFDLQRQLQENPQYRTQGLNFLPRKRSRIAVTLQLRVDLLKLVPYERDLAFPKKIWQTWKVGRDDEAFPGQFRSMSETWLSKNPDHEYSLLSDAECLQIVRDIFKSLPQVVDAYTQMPKSILRADFFRYLIIYAKGGVYSDIDTVCHKPISQWSSASKKLAGEPLDVGLTIGIEADPDRPDWHDWYARRVQFCQWTIQLKPGHPALVELIARITENTIRRINDKTINDVDEHNRGVMDWTGPAIWTDTMFAYMNGIMQLGQPRLNPEEIVLWKLVTGIEQPLAIDDLLILPITSFSPGVGHMGSKDVNDEMAFVQHIFEGSWKGDN